MKTKRCSKCGTELPLSQFGNGGRATQGKGCQLVLAHVTRRDRASDYTCADWVWALAYWNNRCAYCGGEGKKLTADHIYPLSHPLYPGHVPWNVIPACAQCNASKTCRDLDKWLLSKFELPEAARILCDVEAYRLAAMQRRNSAKIYRWHSIQVNGEGVEIVGDNERVIEQSHKKQAWPDYKYGWSLPGRRRRRVYWPEW